MTWEYQPTLEASGIEWPALRNHIPGMAQVTQLALSAFLSSLGVKDRTNSWEAHECNQQFGDNDSIDIGKSQRLRKEGNAWINKVSAMRPGVAKQIEKLRISTNFESPDTDLYIAENACCIDYAAIWLSKWVHSLSESQSIHYVTTCCGCEDMMKLNAGVAWVGLPITRIHLRVAQDSKIQWIPATLHNTGWMD